MNLNKFYILAISTVIAVPAAAQQKNISLEDIWQNGTFAAASVPGFNVLKDGSTYVKTERNGDINIYQLSNNKPKGNLVKAATLSWDGKPVATSNYSFSADEQKMLFFVDGDPIYRHSTLYKVFVYDLKSKELAPIDTAKVLHASFSPDGSKIAYVQNNNILIKNLKTNTLDRVTKDGLQNHIINGNCDWVYEEEFGFTQAYQWSPAGNYLAYYKFDESQVKEFDMFFEDGTAYPRKYNFKYPKAGEANSKVSIHFYDLAKKTNTAADIDANKDQYIPRIKWTTQDDKLCISQLNRHQNHLQLLITDAKTGKTEEIYSEKNKYYLDITDNITFLPDGQSLILSSEQSGYNHLYRWNWIKKELTPLTKGNNEVKDLIGIDIKDQKAYYTATENVLNTGFYQVDLKHLTVKRLSTGTGTHQMTPCTGFKYFVDRFSNTQTVPQISLIDQNGKVVRKLEDNSNLAAKLKEYGVQEPNFVKIPNTKGDSLYAYMIKPANFSTSKKYPVLMYQYSGPGSQQVANKFNLDNFWWHQLLAQKGYIIVVADGTGTGARGEEFKKKTYLQLGKLESEDQIDVANYLAKQSYIDASRIGIWGWSFGGFMSTICILKAPKLFKAAIAVAPVTNWRFYDNIYTERFMRTPAENKDGYDNNAPLSMSKNLEGKYLLVHGIADDNVHVQNATELSKELVKYDRDFDQFYYTNKNHSIYGGKTRLHLYRKMTHFILNNL